MTSKLIAAIDNNDMVGVFKYAAIEKEYLMDGFNLAMRYKNHFLIKYFLTSIGIFIDEIEKHTPVLQKSLTNVTLEKLNVPRIMHVVYVELFKYLDEITLLEYVKDYKLNYEYIKYLNYFNYEKIVEYYLDKYAYTKELIHSVILIAAKYGDLSYYHKFKDWHKVLYTNVHIIDTSIDELVRQNIELFAPLSGHGTRNAAEFIKIRDTSNEIMSKIEKHLENYFTFNDTTKDGKLTYTSQLIFNLASGCNNANFAQILNICKEVVRPEYVNNTPMIRNLFAGAIISNQKKLYSEFLSFLDDRIMLNIITYLIRNNVVMEYFTDAMEYLLPHFTISGDNNLRDITYACIEHKQLDILKLLKDKYDIDSVIYACDFNILHYYNCTEFNEFIPNCRVISSPMTGIITSMVYIAHYDDVKHADFILSCGDIGHQISLIYHTAIRALENRNYKVAHRLIEHIKTYAM